MTDAATSETVWALVDLKHNAVPFVGTKTCIEAKLDSVVRRCEKLDKWNENHRGLFDCERHVWLVSSDDVPPDVFLQMTVSRSVPPEVKEKFQ